MPEHEHRRPGGSRNAAGQRSEPRARPSRVDRAHDLAGLLNLQRLAGNNAVSSVVLQRAPGTASRPAATELAGAREQVLSARRTLPGASSTIDATLADLDGRIDSYGGGVVDNVQAAVDNLNGWVSAISIERLEHYAKTLMDTFGDVVTGTIAGLALGAVLGPAEAALGPVLHKALGQIAGMVLSAGISQYQGSSTNDKVAHDIKMSRAQEALQARATGDLFALLKALTFTRGSPLHALESASNRGHELRDAVTREIKWVDYLADDLHSAQPPPARTVERRAADLAEFQRGYAAWLADCTTVVNETSQSLAQMPRLMRDAFGEVLVRWAAIGGQSPMGKYRAELARYRIVQAIRGQQGTVKAAGRARYIEVGSQTYRLAMQQWPNARDGQSAVVDSVDFMPNLRTPAQQQNELAWTTDQFEVTVTLGGWLAEVPGMIGLEQSAAVDRAWREGHFVCTFEQQPRSDIAAGVVIGSIPAARTRLPSGSPITLIISTAPD